MSIASIIKKVSNLIGKGKPIFGKRKKDVGGNIDLYANINKVKKILKWKPRISLDKGLQITINSYR